MTSGSSRVDLSTLRKGCVGSALGRVTLPNTEPVMRPAPRTMTFGGMRYPQPFEWNRLGEKTAWCSFR